ncbi:MAG: hypothetical protein FWE28_00405 [Oscillospiraceae bacterium]|nr:hypothetical protein [Oscillospiraceae bacterium]
MRPTELNALTTVIVNYLYTSLEEREYTNLAIFLSLLSKEMLAMEAFRELCRIERAIEKEQAEEKTEKS